MLNSILIVGAGPVGLTLAGFLARAGMPFDLIEKRSAPSQYSKALSLSPATLELLQELNVVDEILKEGQKTNIFTVQYNGSPICHFRFDSIDSPYNHFVHIPQWRTEAALRSKIEGCGEKVQWSTELVNMVTHSNGINAQISFPNGSIEQRTYSFVVGADGVNSRVRQMAKFDFDTSGHRDLGFNIRLCDVPFSWSEGRQEAHYLVDKLGFAVVLPLTDSSFRIVIGEPNDTPPSDNWPIESFVKSLVRLGVRKFDIGKPTWCSSARPRSQIVNSMVSGPVALAGDSAHTFSPIGGQGLNTGVQDARRLSLALCGTATELDRELEKYNVERLAIARSTATWTNKLTDQILCRDQESRGTSRYSMLLQSETVESLLPTWLAGLAVPTEHEVKLAYIRLNDWSTA
ncbi:MAG: FAD-dependent oxidoreductase [Phycisphaerales bacterium]